MSKPIRPNPDITGVILAGGQARRMGGNDKGLIEVNGRAMIDYVIQALRPQVSELLINANRHVDRYAALGNCQVVHDEIEGFVGPLAGMASAMSHCRTRYLLAVPCDSPLIAHDLAERLYAALDKNDANISSVHDGERLQPVFALLDRELLPSILDYLETGQRKIDRWYETERFAIADFSDQPDMFLNINTPEERDRLEQTLVDKS